MKSLDDLSRYLAGVLSPAVHPSSLALFRLLYCGALLLSLWDFDQQIPFFYQDRLYHPVPTFTLLDLSIPPELLTYVLFWALIAGLVLGGIGVGSRIPILVAAFAYYYLQGIAMGFMKPPFTVYVYHSRNLAFFALVILALAPRSAHQNISRAWRQPLAATCSGWPAQLIKLTLAIAYFGAAYRRLTISTQWLDGHTLQAYLLERFLLNSSQPALLLAQSVLLCIVLSWATMLFELFFFLSVLIPRTALVWVPAGLAIHGGILWAMDINFFPFFVTAYLAFVVDLRQWWLRRRHPDLQAATAAMRPASKLVFAGMLSLLLGCVLARVEYWPFTNFAVFPQPHHWSGLKVFRLGIRLPDDSFRWSEKGDLCFMTPNTFLARYRAARRAKASWYVERLFDEAGRAAHPERVPEGSVLAVVQRQVKVDGSDIRALDTPVVDIPVPDGRSLCP